MRLGSQQVAFYLLLLALALTVLNLKREPDITRSDTDRIPRKSGLTSTSFCDLLDGRSATTIWTDHVKKIIESSQQTLDKEYILREKVSLILDIVSPRLRYGHRSTSHDREAVQHVYEKLERRFKYLTHGGSDTRIDPVRILVLGGSVTVGVNCVTGIPGYTLKNCSWPSRLEDLVNSLAGGIGLVEVHNLASGGTNSATGQVLLEYELLPANIRNPDIIINAYSTNDMHITTINEASSNNQTLKEKTFFMAQVFVRSALQVCSPQESSPLIVWFDDYLGNEQRQILQTTELSQGVQVLANYYGFGFLSYADTVRELVYRDTTEKVFSPPGWYKGGVAKGMTREIHPTVGMHIAASFLIAFYFLQLAVDHCGLASLRQTEAAGDSVMDATNQRLVDMKPKLDSSLLLDNVSDRWEKTVRLPCHGSRTDNKRCPFSWVSGVSQSDSPENTMAYFNPVLDDRSSGWEWKDDSTKFKKRKKYGFSPVVDGGSAVMVLNFKFPVEVNSMTLFYLKSYGRRWENSMATVTVVSESGDTLFATNLTGFHDKQTSETYTETGKWNRPSGTLQVSISFIGGNTFKLSGIALCNDAG